MSTEMKKTYMARAVEHYSSLFNFPGYWLLLTLLFLVNIVGSTVAFVMIYPYLEAVKRGLTFGLLVLSFPITIVDIILWVSITREDKIFNLRRYTALSLFTCSFWIVILIAGGLAQAISKTPFIVNASVFGASTAISFRFLIFRSITHQKNWKNVFLAFFQPTICLLLTLFFWSTWTPSIYLTFIFSSIVLLIADLAFIYLVNKQGELAIGIGAITLFKSFLSNWFEGAIYPLEHYLEKLGTDADVSINLFAFKSKKNLQSFMLVTDVHPGPFRNVGSSNLPYMIQETLENAFKVITVVPHGASGHELDLTSQSQCDRVIKEIHKLVEFSNFSPYATKLIRVETNRAKVTCQFLGGTALLTVTRSLTNLDDLPIEVGREIVHIGKKLGADKVVVIDAHNIFGVINEVPFLIEDEVEEIKTAARRALKKTLQEKTTTFKVGVAKVIPEEFTPSQGMGPGGIVALVFIVDEQRIAYITIDGNNMVRGLRERILQVLEDLVDECEVLTTDTHVVNALGAIERGYHPVGEAMDHERLIFYIRECVTNGLKRAEWAEVTFNTGLIQNIRVIGAETLLSLTMLVDKTLKYAKRIAPLIYIPALTISVISFFFI